MQKKVSKELIKNTFRARKKFDGVTALDVIGKVAAFNALDSEI